MRCSNELGGANELWHDESEKTFKKAAVRGCSNEDVQKRVETDCDIASSVPASQAPPTNSNTHRIDRLDPAPFAAPLRRVHQASGLTLLVLCATNVVAGLLKYRELFPESGTVFIIVYPILMVLGFGVVVFTFFRVSGRTGFEKDGDDKDGVRKNQNADGKEPAAQKETEETASPTSQTLLQKDQEMKEVAGGGGLNVVAGERIGPSGREGE